MFRALVTASVLALSAPAVMAESTLDMGTAYQQAVAQVGPGATLIKARSEGPGVFGFYFMKNRRVIEIEITGTAKAPTTIKVASSATGGVSEDVLRLIARFAADKVKLPEGRLMEIAADSLKTAAATEAGFQVEDGKLVFVAGNDRIDPVTGQKTAGKSKK